MTSPLERRFDIILLARSRVLPAPVREYRFIHAESPAVQQRYLSPVRRQPRAWAFDRAWPDARLAVELDGIDTRNGSGGGRHWQQADREKLAAAEALGWLVLHFTAPELRQGSNVLAIVTAMYTSRIAGG